MGGGGRAAPPVRNQLGFFLKKKKMKNALKRKNMYFDIYWNIFIGLVCFIKIYVKIENIYSYLPWNCWKDFVFFWFIKNKQNCLIYTILDLLICLSKNIKISTKFFVGFRKKRGRGGGWSESCGHVCNYKVCFLHLFLDDKKESLYLRFWNFIFPGGMAAFFWDRIDSSTSIMLLG